MKNVAVIGFGFMGMTHVANILKNQNLNLVAIVTKNPDKIEAKLTSKTGNFDIEDIDLKAISQTRKYSTIDDCLASEKLDTVHICVHTDLHYELSKKCLSNGLHVFLEKPMTLELDEGQELIELAKKKKRILMVGHVVRFMSPYQKLKKWIDEKSYGSLRFLSLSRFSGLPGWGQWKDKQKAFGSSGGALFDFLIHDIDFAQYALGIPDKIQSTTLPGKLSNHDYISAFWEYQKSGLKVKVEGGNTFHTSFPFQAGYMANFDHASIFYSTLKPEIIQVATDGDIINIPVQENVDGFYREIDYFYKCIENKVTPDLCLPESSLETIKLCYKHLD